MRLVAGLGIWFLVQTFEEEIQTKEDAAQGIREICKLLEEAEESGEEGASCYAAFAGSKLICPIFSHRSCSKR